MSHFKLIGLEVKRKEDPRLMTGKGTYVGNMQLTGMKHVAFVRSPYAHANIRKIDVKAALKRSGVAAVVTGEELVPLYGSMPHSSLTEGGGETVKRHHTHYPVSVGKVRHVGEAVALVIADDPYIAADAVQDVEVDWEPLPAVVDMFEAMKPGAPLVHNDAANNVEHVWIKKHGDVNGAFAKADRIVKERFVEQRITGVPMESFQSENSTESYLPLTPNCSMRQHLQGCRPGICSHGFASTLSDRARGESPVSTFATLTWIGCRRVASGLSGGRFNTSVR